MEPRVAARRFLDWGGRTDDGAAIDDRAQRRTWSHGELRDAVVTRHGLFAREKRGLVMVLCRLDVATIVDYLAALLANHAVMLVDAGTPAPALATIAAAYQPDFILGAEAMLAEYTPIGVHAFASTASAPAIDGPVAVLLTTSGTTGTPRYVRLSGENVLANAEAIAEYLALNAAERPALVLPLHYSYGLSVLNSHLVAGATLVIPTPGLLRREFWDDVTEAACTSMAGVPYTFNILERMGYLKTKRHAFRTLTQAGGRLDAQRVEAFHLAQQADGGRVVVMYGQTEATARIAYVPPTALPAKAHTIGVAIPGGELELVKNGVRVSSPGVEGELVYRGPNVMLGYACDRADLGRGDEMGSILRTGDLGTFDTDGYFAVTGRIKRVAKLLGVRINLDEVETRLRTRGPAAAVADDSRIVLFCEWEDSSAFAAAREELALFLRLHASHFEFRHVDSLPLTPSGKTDYGLLRV